MYLKFLTLLLSSSRLTCNEYCIVHQKARVIMPRQIAKKFIFLVFLNLVVASPVLFGRDEVGDDSFWGLDLEDLVGAGAAGLEGLSKLWDFSNAPEPGVSTIVPPEAAPKEPDVGSLETPDPVDFPLFESPKTMICPVAAGASAGYQIDRLAIERSRWQVEQEPESGYVAISSHPPFS